MSNSEQDIGSKRAVSIAEHQLWFKCLLEKLDPDPDKAAAEYVLVSETLIQRFDHRHCVNPEKLAEVTLLRVGKKLAEGAVLEKSIRAFISGFDKKITLEERKKWRAEFLKSLDADEVKVDPPDPNQVAKLDSMISDQQSQIEEDCLRSCLNKLGPNDKLFFAVYDMFNLTHEEQQKYLGYELSLADSCRVDKSKVRDRQRATRLRHELKKCANACVAAQDSGGGAIMTERNNDNSRLKAYILGQLTEEEALDLETDLFVDENLHSLLEDAKQELIDAYLSDRLPSEEQTQYRAYLARSAKALKELQFAQSLHRVTGEFLQTLSPDTVRAAANDMQAATVVAPILDSPPVSTFGERLLAWWQSLVLSPQFSVALGACGLLLVGGLSWSLWRNAQLQNQIEQERMARVTSERQTAEQVNLLSEEKKSLLDKLMAAISGEVDAPEKPVIVAANIKPADPTPRSGATSKRINYLTLDANTQAVKLHFNAFKTDMYTQYQVILRRGTETVWGPRRLTTKSPQQPRLSIVLPGNLLKSGDYTLALSGVDTDDKPADGVSFNLTVTRK